MAARYWVGSGTNWNSTSSWSTTNGGASGASVPISSDDVYFTSLSNNAVVTASSVCNNIDCTGYTGTWSGSGGLSPSGGTIIMSATMVKTWTGTLTLLNTTVSITSNGFLWNALTISTAGQTITLVDDMSVTTYTHTGSGATNTINGANFIWRGTGTFSMTSGRVLTGSSTVVLAPSTSGSISISGSIASNVSINATGTINQIAAVTISGGTWTYTAGTWNYGTSAFSISGNCTLNLAGMPIYRLLTGAAATCTLTSLLTVVADVQYSLATGFVFAGTHGFTCTTLTDNTTSTARTITLAAGIEYFVTSSLYLQSGWTGSKPSIVSGTPGTKAKLTLIQGCTQLLPNCNITDIDASNGITICVYNGTISNCDNVRNLKKYQPTITYSS